MKTRISLKKYEKMYKSFDGGHDLIHLNEVRNFAIELGKKYAPDKLEIIYAAATLHDIGLSVSREDHEKFGYEIISKDDEIREAFSKIEYEEILEAIKEHRASVGNPQSVVAKIVSDADKVAPNTDRSMTRAYKWGEVNLPTLNHDGQLLRAAYHLHEKFGTGGSGTRLYFKESSLKLARIYKPIFDALVKYDLRRLNSFLIKDE